MLKSKQKFRELFLRQFVIKAIINSVPELNIPKPTEPIPKKSIPIHKVKTPQKPLTQRLTLHGMRKLNHLIADRSVLSIECPGPNKHIMINKSGLIRTTNITLSKHEIAAVVKDFSEKTKIPLVRGIFKAVIGKLLITAVISEFVGTRFIIQKRTPAY